MAILLWRKPTLQSIRDFLTRQAEECFTYSEVGATGTGQASGFDRDHQRIKLGEGEPVFQSARDALQRWEQFRLGWVEVVHPPQIVSGEVVAILGRAFGLWWLNSCRIIDVIDETGPVNRFGFAYRTLPNHVEKGEERFLIEWDREDNSVWYDILAYSRPNHPLAWMGYPLVRRFQEQFRRDSARAMMRATGKTHDQSVACPAI